MLIKKMLSYLKASGQCGMGMISTPVVAKVYRLGEQFDNIRKEKSLLIDAVVLFLYLPEFYSITYLFFSGT